MTTRIEFPIDVNGQLAIDADGEPIAVRGSGPIVDLEFASLRAAFRFIMMVRRADAARGRPLSRTLGRLGVTLRLLVRNCVVGESRVRAHGPRLRLRPFQWLRAALRI